MRRQLTVHAVERATPNLVRVTLHGDLATFKSDAPDDHLKVFVPDGTEQPAMRDYTPRRFDTLKGELVLEFAVHEAGPASDWATGVTPGQTLQIAGPRGSRVLHGPIERWVLVGDLAALPAIARRLEEAAPGSRFTTVVVVPSEADVQPLSTAAEHQPVWIVHPDPADPEPFLAALGSQALDPGTFVWIATERGVMRDLRAHLDERGHDADWSQATAYWTAGVPQGGPPR